MQTTFANQSYGREENKELPIYSQEKLKDAWDSNNLFTSTTDDSSKNGSWNLGNLAGIVKFFA